MIRTHARYWAVIAKQMLTDYRKGNPLRACITSRNPLYSNTNLYTIVGTIHKRFMNRSKRSASKSTWDHRMLVLTAPNGLHPMENSVSTAASVASTTKRIVANIACTSAVNTNDVNAYKLHVIHHLRCLDLNYLKMAIMRRTFSRNDCVHNFVSDIQRYNSTSVGVWSIAWIPFCREVIALIARSESSHCSRGCLINRFSNIL